MTAVYEYIYSLPNIRINTNCVIPTDYDILCGRGSTCYKHVGNQHFRCIVAMHLPKYANPSTTRKEKGIMIQEIVNESLGEGRRFLKEGLSGWYVLCHKEAKYKVGHALRDAAAEMKRFLSKDPEKSRDKSHKATSLKMKSDSGVQGIKKEKLTNKVCNREIDNCTQETVISSLNQEIKQLQKSSNKESEMDEQDIILRSSISQILSAKDNEDINADIPADRDEKDDNSWFDTVFSDISSDLFDEEDTSDSI